MIERQCTGGLADQMSTVELVAFEAVVATARALARDGRTGEARHALTAFLARRGAR